jgi:hypothetical protein
MSDNKEIKMSEAFNIQNSLRGKPRHHRLKSSNSPTS